MRSGGSHDSILRSSLDFNFLWEGVRLRRTWENTFLVRELDVIQAPGRDQPVAVYELLAEGDGAPPPFKPNAVFIIMASGARPSRSGSRKIFGEVTQDRL